MEKVMDAEMIRTVTDQEVLHLRDHGWVKLDRLISEEFAGLLLDRAKACIGSEEGDHIPRPGLDLPTPFWSDYHDVVEEDESFASLALNPLMGLNAQRLMGRNVGVLLWSNLLAVKIGAKQSAEASEPTVFHQDGPDLPFDRGSWVRFWIALDHLTLDMGPVRFVDRSHVLGSVGCAYLQEESTSDLFDSFPQLAQMTVSEPAEFNPGDATVHSMFTVHGSRGNNTDRPRWALLLAYFADDTLYTGNAICAPSNLVKVEKAGMVPGERFGPPMYPRVPLA
jgi:Phytanoyl-CoA dioxygenase (PhyH)